MQHELLRSDLSLEEAEVCQSKYSQILNFQKPKSINYNSIKSVAGVDVSYFNEGNREWGIACAVLWDIHASTMEHHSFSKDVIKFPYKPGYLGFREVNLIAKAIKFLPKLPDIIMCDGHGIIHPKRFGEAVQLGLALDISTIGVAKSFFIGYSEWKNLDKIKSSKAPIWAFNPEKLSEKPPELLGYAICVNDGSKPIFVSVGYKTTLELAMKIALQTTTEHKQPEPLHLADHLSREEIRKYIEHDSIP